MNDEQYSGYHSKLKTTDLEIFDLIREMSSTSLGSSIVLISLRSPMRELITI